MQDDEKKGKLDSGTSDVENVFEKRVQRGELLKYAGAVGGAVLLGAPAASAARLRARRLGASKTLTIGVDGPFTGASASTGTELKNAVTQAFGNFGNRVGPYKIKLVWIDDQSDPAKGTAAYEQAVVAQHIQAGLLNWNSSVASALMDVVSKHKIPHFFGMGATATVNQKFAGNRNKYGYWMAKGWPDPKKLTDTYVLALQDAIKANLWKPSAKQVALYGEDTDWGHSELAGLKPQFEAAGWTVVSEDYFPLTQTDFTALLTRYANDKVPVIAGTTTAAASVSGFVKQVQQLGLHSVVVADGLGYIGNWYQLTGSASNNVLDMIPEWASPKARKFAALMKKKYGYTPSPVATGIAYDLANFFIKILRTSLADHGELTSASIYQTGRTKLWTGKLTYTGGVIMDRYAYTPRTIPDPMVGPGNFVLPVLQYHNGNSTIIYPRKVATGKFQPPSS